MPRSKEPGHYFRCAANHRNPNRSDSIRVHVLRTRTKMVLVSTVVPCHDFLIKSREPIAHDYFCTLFGHERECVGIQQLSRLQTHLELPSNCPKKTDFHFKKTRRVLDESRTLYSS